MSKLHVLVIHNNSVELDRISALLKRDNHAVLPLDNMSEASEALELQRFDAVLVPNETPEEVLATFALNLREMERSRHIATRTSILSCSRNATEAEILIDGQKGRHIDACLPVAFEPSTFTKTVEQLVRRVSSVAAQNESANELAVFDAEGFGDLLGDSPELIEEILGLFFEESAAQVAQMDASLSGRDFESLSKLAHTLKGSFGTLNAHQAHARAHALEMTAATRNQPASESGLTLLKASLAELMPQLIRLRSSL